MTDSDDEPYSDDENVGREGLPATTDADGGTDHNGNLSVPYGIGEMQLRTYPPTSRYDRLQGNKNTHTNTKVNPKLKVASIEHSTLSGALGYLGGAITFRFGPGMKRPKLEAGPGSSFLHHAFCERLSAPPRIGSKRSLLEQNIAAILKELTSDDVAENQHFHFGGQVMSSYLGSVKEHYGMPYLTTVFAHVAKTYEQYRVLLTPPDKQFSHIKGDKDSMLVRLRALYLAKLGLDPLLDACLTGPQGRLSSEHSDWDPARLRPPVSRQARIDLREMTAYDVNAPGVTYGGSSNATTLAVTVKEQKKLGEDAARHAFTAEELKGEFTYQSFTA